MDPEAASPDRRLVRCPADGEPSALGGDVRRWIREADDRLASLDVRATEVPRADDFGHLTAQPPASSPRAAPAAGSRAVEATSSTVPARPADRTADRAGAPTPGGIVVAAGWGARPRA